jgi:platelet-activating factor acetylhydrolase
MNLIDSWDDTNKSENPTPLPLRTEQLEFRQQELYIAYRTFCRFLETDPSLELETIDNAKINSESWSFSDPVSGKKPVLYMENVTLAGHSFGGCTVVSSF